MRTARQLLALLQMVSQPRGAGRPLAGDAGRHRLRGWCAHFRCCRSESARGGRRSPAQPRIVPHRNARRGRGRADLQAGCGDHRERAWRAPRPARQVHGERHCSGERHGISKGATTRGSPWRGGRRARIFPRRAGAQVDRGPDVPAGMHELIVGKTRYTEERGMSIGDRIWLRGDEWTVVEDSRPTERPMRCRSPTPILSCPPPTAPASGGSWQRLISREGPATLEQALKASPTLHVELEHDPRRFWTPGRSPDC